MPRIVESMQFSGIRLNVETAATLLVKGKQDVFWMAQSMIGEMPNKVDKWCFVLITPGAA